MIKFELEHTEKYSRARAGKLHLSRGVVETPIFMPVGTLGAIKALNMELLHEQIKPDIILANTYHLYLRPGMDVITESGGIHGFNAWDKPILTDSGGYQVYSLAAKRKIKEEGVLFQSHIDGSRHMFSPESVMGIQRQIGADVIMAFDECTPYPCELNYARKSMHMTHRWLDRCIDAVDKSEALYGHEQLFAPIVQGSVYEDLRKQSAEYIASKGAELNAIGGLSVGEPSEDLYKHTFGVCQVLPQDKGRYLMGVGKPEDLLECIDRGVDMFDCVLPTRNARHGLIYTRQGKINIKNRKWRNDFSVIDEHSRSTLSQKYSKSYLRHLVHCGEHFGAEICTLHNLCFYMDLVRDAREHILADTFTSWKSELMETITRKL